MNTSRKTEEVVSREAAPAARIIGQATPATASYLSLLNGDLSINRAAFESILASRVISEINMRLCVARGLMAPRTIPLGEVQAWRAACVKQFALGPISDGERRSITKHERAELEAWCAAAQRAGAKQRAAMDDAYHVAAE